MKFIDLFCGCGGFSEGLRQAGHECVLAIDNWEIALKSHEANHPEAEHWNKDILTIKPQELPKTNFIVGSPPCPDFSPANRTKPKNPDLSLLNQFLRLSKDYKYYVGENVPLIKNHLNGCDSQRLEALNFGLLHRRPRVFFGKFPKIKKLTRNKAYFPTPRAANRNTSKQIAINLHRVNKPKHIRKKHDFQLAYPWHVSKWIMGFPEDYIFMGNDREKEIQIGNAVCPPVAKAIGEALPINQGKIINELIKPKEKRGERGVGRGGPKENHINNILGRVYRR